MNFHTTINNLIKASSLAANVATAAGFSQADWAIHVFDSGRGFAKGMSRGRAPYVSFWRADTDYSFDCVTTTGRGGQVNSTWIVEVVARRDSESQAYEIMQKFLYNLRTNQHTRIGNESIGEAMSHPFGVSLQATITIENTFDDSSK